jgi:hypothetical protein
MTGGSAASRLVHDWQNVIDETDRFLCCQGTRQEENQQAENLHEYLRVNPPLEVK